MVSASVNLATERASVQALPTLSAATLAQAVVKAGYEATVVLPDAPCAVICLTMSFDFIKDYNLWLNRTMRVSCS